MLSCCFDCLLKGCHNNWENITTAAESDVDINDDSKTMIRTMTDAKRDDWKRLATLVNRVFLFFHFLFVLTLFSVFYVKFRKHIMLLYRWY